MMENHKTPWPLAATVYVCLAAWVIVAAFPLVWMAIISFRTPIDAFSIPPELFAPVTFDNWYRIWVEGGFVWNFINSLVITLGVVTVSLTIGCFAGYALARYPGNWGFWLLIIALIFRAMPHATLLPAYKFGAFELGLWNRYITLILILVAVNQPFTIWMLRSFFQNIPKDLDEAAMVDGCTRGRRLLSRHHAGDVAGRDHDGPVLVPLGLQRLPGCSTPTSRR